MKYVCQLCNVSKKAVRDVSDFLWKANIRKDDVKLYLKLGFWYDVMLAWASYNYEYPNYKMKILKQQIWANSIHANKEGNPFVNTRAIHAVFCAIKEIIDENGEFYNYTTIKHNSRNTISTNEYEELKDAFPELKLRLLKYNLPNRETRDRLNKLLNVERPANLIYTNMIYFEYAADRKRQRWEDTLHEDINLDDCLKSFNNIYKIMNLSKLRFPSNTPFYI